VIAVEPTLSRHAAQIDMKPVEPQTNNGRAGVEMLRAQWKAAMQFLKRSGLKKRGNPLYVLPWYLVIGPAGSGKTTALRRTRLPSFAEANGPAPLAETRHCEWSFFDSAIVIDTAGRYADPAGQDKEEWRTLLDLLLKCRAREPLNGLTIVVAADQLLKDSAEALENAGKTLRKRVDELMRVLGFKVPVYLLVAKCDLISGMPAFCERLSEKGRNQAMGGLNDDANSDVMNFLDKTFSALCERLKGVRLVMASQPKSEAMDPALLIFPETFGKLRDGLGSFLRGAFQENLYQETPHLRGLFFASSGCLGDAALDAKSGCFLHDLFSKILPADRALFTPTRRIVSWRRKTLSLGMMAWLVLAVAVCGWMSWSFIKNMQTLSALREANQEFTAQPGAPGDLGSTILAMDRFSQSLLALEKRNNGGFFSFGPRDAAGVEAGLKAALSAQFRRELLGPTDEQYRDAIAALTPSSSDDRFSQFIAHLVGRLSLLRERLKGTDLDDLQKAPPSIPFLRAGGREIDSDIKERFSRLYVDSVFWFSDGAKLNQEWASLQGELKRLLNLKGRDPRWLIAWAAAQNSIAPVTLSDAWGGRPLSALEPSIPGLFTAKGKGLIDGFFKEVEGALNDPAVSSDLKSRFGQWYRENAFKAWYQFVVAFPRGIGTLSSAELRRQTAARMAGDDGAYFALMKHIPQEFESVAQADLPPWMKHMRQAGDLQKNPAFWKYRQSLEKVTKAISDPSQASQATAQVFDGQTPAESTVFGAAFEALAKLKMSAPKELAGDAAIWKLISGPLDFLWQDARRETADRLQSDWESKVLAQATGLDAAQALPVLLAKDGPAMRFVKDQAAPFVQWKPGAGYSAKDVFNGALPFTGAFFSFLDGAVWMSSVNDLHVSVTALTPDTNANAKRIPHITRLTLNCGGKNQVLSNRRLRVIEKSFNTVDQSFAWSPSCSETVLEIDLAGSRLLKSYPGAYGFFAFLHDFKDGKHTFHRSDFPEQAKALTELSVDAITLHYRLKGAPDFAAPKAAPAKIVWDSIP
jgi:type VI secretion system protein ImpL